MNITMYVTMVCPYCHRAERLLTEKGVGKYIEKIYVDNNPQERAKMMERSGGLRTVPQIFINDQHVGGCDDLYALDRQGKLNPLLNM